MTVGYPLQRDSGARAARNLDFCRLLLFFGGPIRHRVEVVQVTEELIEAMSVMVCLIGIVIFLTNKF